MGDIHFTRYTLFIHRKRSVFKTMVIIAAIGLVLNIIRNLSVASMQRNEHPGRFPVKVAVLQSENTHHSAAATSSPNVSSMASVIRMKDLPPSYHQGGLGPYINLLHEIPPPFLPNFKNPCWLEELPLAYPYAEEPTCRRKPICGLHEFKQNAQVFLKRIQAGTPWRIRCLPYFYLAGFVKCGTSEIFHNLAGHPMVASSWKEIHWWNVLRIHSWHKLDMAFPIRNYIDMFDKAAMAVNETIVINKDSQDVYHPMIIGDGTTLTVSQQHRWWYNPENEGTEETGPKYITAQYLRHVTPDAKIIITMRNPANRLYSFYTMNNGKGPMDFDARVRRAVDSMNACIPEKGAYPCVNFPSTDRLIVLSDSMYYLHLVEWLKLFPRRQFFTVKLEEYSKDRVKGLNMMFKFLGLEEVGGDVLQHKSYNVRVGCRTCTMPPMLNKTRLFLDHFFQPYNERLADLLQDQRWLFQ